MPQKKLDQTFFSDECKKLFEQFGRPKFSNHKLVLIYKELMWVSDIEFTRIIDDIVGNCRTVPTINDFKTAVIKNRETVVAKEKRQHAKEAKQFFKPEELQQGFKVIHDCLNSGNWAPVKKMNAELDKVCQSKCKLCFDSGTVYGMKKGEIMGTSFVCNCEAGQYGPQNHARWGRQTYAQGFKTKAEWEREEKIQSNGG